MLARWQDLLEEECVFAIRCNWPAEHLDIISLRDVAAMHGHRTALHRNVADLGHVPGRIIANAAGDKIARINGGRLRGQRAEGGLVIGSGIIVDAQHIGIVAKIAA